MSAPCVAILQRRCVPHGQAFCERLGSWGERSVTRPHRHASSIEGRSRRQPGLRRVLFGYLSGMQLPQVDRDITLAGGQAGAPLSRQIFQ